MIDNRYVQNVDAMRVRPQDEFKSVDSKPPRKPLRRCGSTLKVPNADGTSYTVYTCSRLLSEHSEQDTTFHSERGRVRMKGGKIIEYSMTWNDGESEVWREMRT